MSQSEDPPEIKDSPGRWDNRTAYAILVTPFLLITVAVFAVVGLVATGSVPIEVVISGTLPATKVFNTIIMPLVLVFGALLALTWLLALMKVFGVNPVVWVVQRIANAAENYNPSLDVTDDDN